MSINLEEKYIHLLSSRLRNFKKKKPHLYYFSCPFCGDSKTRKRLARGTVYQKKGKLLYNCFNCDKSTYATNIIKELDPNLYREYIKEKLVFESTSEEKIEKKDTESISTDVFDSLKTINELEPFHPVRKYLRNRCIPIEHLGYLRYSPKFKQWTNELIPGTFEVPIQYEEPRLIIPFIDKIGVIGFTARSFDPNTKLKYVAITLDDSRSRVFGLDRVDNNKEHYVVEGPIDSLFLPNCIAVGTTSLTSVANKNSILIYDNQPRNKELCIIQEKAIDAGHRVVIWPDNLEEKDINDLVMNGKNPLDIISSNIYSGLKAKIRFNEWRKI